MICIGVPLPLRLCLSLKLLMSHVVAKFPLLNSLLCLKLLSPHVSILSHFNLSPPFIKMKMTRAEPMAVPTGNEGGALMCDSSDSLTFLRVLSQVGHNSRRVIFGQRLVENST